MQKSAAKPLILVDGSSYLYRAFHAMPSLMNSKGFHTGAIYGVINMLRKLLSDYDPENIAVVFDAKGKTFRDDLYDKYKANRSAMPDDLIHQIEPIHAIIEALGIPILMIEGVEADDVIGTLAHEATLQGMNTLISTGDKDLAQLVNEHVTLVNTMSGNFLNPTTVKEKFGIPPELIIDYLALVGDSIDNIPGVPQVGPKTAVKWLIEHGSLDNIVKHADKISGKVGENLRTALSSLPLSKTLATIKIDVPLPLTFAELQRKSPEKNILRKIYQELEFKTWLAELLEETKTTDQQKHVAYENIQSDQQLSSWLKKLSEVDFFAMDIQSTESNYMNANILGIAIAIAPGKAAYFSEKMLSSLKPILEDPKIKKIGHDFKFIMEVLSNHQIHLQGIAFDTMLESYILDSSNNKHDLNSLGLKYLGWRIISFEEIAGKGAKQIPFHEIPVDKISVYAAEKADVVLQLHQLLWPRLNQENGLKHVFTEIELPLLSVLMQIEKNGVLLDAEKLAEQNEVLETRLQELEKEIFSIAESEFNLNSPKQLQEILFNKLKLPMLQKTPKGQPSTADHVLQELALDFLFPKLIIEYRSLSKLITTYTKKLPEQIHPRTHRIHTTYNQTVAATGRLSSSDPNLQNIPVRHEAGRRIRQTFIASKGHKIISADYSQIELRIMAHISNDPNLLSAFQQELDIHRATAAEVMGITIEEVTFEDRRNAKAVNFGLIYGMSAFGLGKQLGLGRAEAQGYIDRYFLRYPGVKNYMEATRAKAHSSGFVETLTGRRLYLPDINSSQIPRQKAAERAAINAPLQGTAADIIKRAMITLHHWLREHPEVDAKIIMQVHDELVFEVAEKDINTMKQVICEHMMASANLKVPLTVSIGVGENWDDASKN